MKLITILLLALAMTACGGSGEDKTNSGAGVGSNTTINIDSGGGDVQICIIETTSGEIKAGATTSVEACGAIGGIPLNDGDVSAIGLTEASTDPTVPFVENCSAASQANGVCQPIPGSEN